MYLTICCTLLNLQNRTIPLTLQAICFYSPFILLYHCNCFWCCKMTELNTEINERDKRLGDWISLQMHGDSGQTANSISFLLYSILTYMQRILLSGLSRAAGQKESTHTTISVRHALSNCSVELQSSETAGAGWESNPQNKQTSSLSAAWILLNNITHQLMSNRPAVTITNGYYLALIIIHSPF